MVERSPIDINDDVSLPRSRRSVLGNLDVALSANGRQAAISVGLIAIAAIAIWAGAHQQWIALVAILAITTVAVILALGSREER